MTTYFTEEYVFTNLDDKFSHWRDIMYLPCTSYGSRYWGYSSEQNKSCYLWSSHSIRVADTKPKKKKNVVSAMKRNKADSG